ncbi:hypothetical protein [Geminicoccus flavidas]|uniref:hypothetical protein n=1 Tax=Geminicoccus flavidas TaxID=2506407 RepID=UPI00135C0AB7|nr:hypothetical protein [Geminicoccus flavidas]
MTAPSHDKQPIQAHLSEKLDQTEADRRRADRLIAELEALLEEARQLRARYLPRKREPDIDR